ncbi:MAG: DNA gyrase C-terminal beta-propeller domain-containing protein, partial [Eubacterium sp.]
LSPGGEIMMINNQGVVIKLEGDGISKVGRNTQGVRLMKLKENERIATISKVYKEDPEDDEETPADDDAQMTLLDE